MKRAPLKPEDFIVPLNINGLEGRMLRLPAPKGKKRSELLFVYGSHSTLERWWGVSLELNKLGAFTMPDLPGLGGMTPLYKIGKKATIDNMADYLAAFIKLKYRNKRVSIVGMSLGFVITTRMLQKYPELTKKVDLLISVVGFSHKEDFIYSKNRMRFYKTASWLLSHKWPATIFRYTLLNKRVIKSAYHKTFNAKEKFQNVSGGEFKRNMEMEVELWHKNDVRTQFKNYLELFKLDNTKKHIDLPVYHVAAKKDRYFNIVRVEEHMRRIFNDFQLFYTTMPNHAPTVITSSKEAANFIPKDLRAIINKRR